MKKLPLKELDMQEMQSIHGGDHPLLKYLQNKIDEIMEVIREETSWGNE